MGLKEILGLAEETLGIVWWVKLKAIIDEMVAKDIKLIPKENFQEAKKILKDLILLIESQEINALINTCGGISSAFKNAKNLKDKIDKNAMKEIISIIDKSDKALNGKIYKEGKFRSELIGSLEKLADHMKKLALQAEAREKAS